MLKMFRLKLAFAAIFLGYCRAQEAAVGECKCVAYSFCQAADIVASNCDSLQEVCCKVPGIPYQGNFKCGQRGKPKKDHNEDIDVGDFYKLRGGDETYHGEYPWMVAIMNISDPNRMSFLCGGSIIYPNVVLTTAHSVSGLSESQLLVKAGVWNTSSTSEQNHQDVPVTKIIIHNEFVKRKAANNVALIILSESLETSDYVGPVCLPSPTQPYNDSRCIATGWGAEEFGSTDRPSTLKKMVIPLVDSATCETKLRTVPKLGPSFKLQESSICAGTEKGDTCKGDGGGPLMCPTIEDPEQYVQVGITSWGIECGKGGIPGVYTSIAAVDAWIEEQVNAIEGTYPVLYSEDVKQQS